MDDEDFSTELYPQTQRDAQFVEWLKLNQRSGYEKQKFYFLLNQNPIN